MALNAAQQRALDALFAQVDAPVSAAPARNGFGLTQVLSMLSGLPEASITERVDAIGARMDAIELSFVDWAERRPLDAVMTVLGGAALAFYQAEKGVNPKIETFTDAFYYISTCASVGYADIFAQTQTGKAIASFVMIIGPALAAKSLDRPGR
jgi:hypothetical protein